jgi:hypothetical protein
VVRGERRIDGCDESVGEEFESSVGGGGENAEPDALFGYIARLLG